MKIKHNESYGDFIKRIRQREKLTQMEFCIKSGLGLTSVRQWENGKTVPSLTSQRVIDEFARKIK